MRCIHCRDSQTLYSLNHICGLEVEGVGLARLVTGVLYLLPYITSDSLGTPTRLDATILLGPRLKLNPPNCTTAMHLSFLGSML